MREHHKFIERLVCDDDIDFKSGADDQSSGSIMQSPQLSAVSGLRVPVSTFHGYGPGINLSNSRT